MNIIYTYSTVQIEWHLNAGSDYGQMNVTPLESGFGLAGTHLYAWYTVGHTKKTLTGTVRDGVLEATMQGELESGVYNLYVEVWTDGALVMEEQAMNAFAVTEIQKEAMNADGQTAVIKIEKDATYDIVDDVSEYEPENIQRLPRLYVYGNVEIVWDMEREFNVRPELKSMDVHFTYEVGCMKVERPCKIEGDSVKSNIKRTLKTGVHNCYLTFKDGNETVIVMQVLTAFVASDTQPSVMNPDGATVTLNLKSGRVVNAVVTPLVDPTDIAYLGDLFDVNLKTHIPEVGEVLLFNGSTWESRYVEWDEIRNKPTWLTKEVPDLGIFTNNAGYIKRITRTMIIKALGYIPLSGVTWNDVKDKPRWVTAATPDLGDFGNEAGYIKLEDINRTNIINALGYDPSEGVSYLRSLKDVNVSNVQDGNALVYNSATGMWVAGRVAAGTGDLSGYLTKADASKYYLTIAEFNKWFYRYNIGTTSVTQTTEMWGKEYLLYKEEDETPYFAYVESNGNVTLYDDDITIYEDASPFDYYNSIEALEADGFIPITTTQSGGWAIGTKQDLFSERGIAAYGPFTGGTGGGSGSEGTGGGGGVSSFADLTEVDTAMQGIEDGYAWTAVYLGDNQWTFDWAPAGKTYKGSTYIDINSSTNVISLKGCGDIITHDANEFAKAAHTHKLADITDFSLTLWGNTVNNTKKTANGTITFSEGTKIVPGQGIFFKGENFSIYTTADTSVDGVPTLNISNSDGVHIKKQLHIGNITLEEDSNGNLKISKSSGVANLYTTGGISAFGYGESQTAEGVTSFAQLEEVSGSKPTTTKAWGYDAVRKIYTWVEIGGGGITYTASNNYISINNNDHTIGLNETELGKLIKKTKVDEAEKAAKDGNGNTISDYYVTLSTNQEINGVKTFTSGTTYFGINGIGISTDRNNNSLSDGYKKHTAFFSTANKLWDETFMYVYENGVVSIPKGLSIGASEVGSDKLYVNGMTTLNGNLKAKGDFIIDVGKKMFYIDNNDENRTMYNTLEFSVNETVTSLHIGYGNRLGETRLYGGTVFIRRGERDVCTFGKIDANKDTLGLRTNNVIRIGDAMLSWDSNNKALKLSDINGGGSMNFYATGGIAAYNALGSFDRIEDLQIANTLTVGKSLAIGNALITHRTTSDGTDELAINASKSNDKKNVKVEGSITAASYITANTNVYANGGIKVGVDGTAIQQIWMGSVPAVNGNTSMYMNINGLRYRLTLTREA